MKFLMIDSELLANTYFMAAHKLMLAFLISLHKQGRGYWGSESNLAKIFGAKQLQIEQVISELEDIKLIYRDSEGTIRLGADIDAIYEYTAQVPIRSKMRKQVENSEGFKTFDEIMNKFLDFKGGI